MQYEGIWLFFIVVPALAMGFWLAWLLRLALPLAVLLALGIGAITGFFLTMVADHSYQPDPGSIQAYLHERLNKDNGGVAIVAIVVGANLLAALLVKIYAAMVLNKATTSERQRGMAGMRAWLCPSNISAVIGLSVAAYIGLDYSVVGTLILGFGLLLIYPLIGTLTQTPQTDTTPPQAPAEERQRVLALVEAGKISAEDAAELLSALAQSQAAEVKAAAVVSFSPARRIMIAGAAAVLLGFLCPWFTIDLVRAANAAVSLMQSQGQAQLQSGMQPIDGSNGVSINLPPGMALTPNAQARFTLRGGDVHDGLGWIILVGGFVAAGLPFFWTLRPANAQQHRNAVLVTLGAGSVTVLYVLSGAFNAFTSIEMGFVVTIAGYGLMWVGAVREYVAGRAMPGAVAMA